MKKLRPPIVTILGHVDHGKTSLLDYIRKTNDASREAGGITQSIGAFRVVSSDGEFTFIDTPGHAAFSSMRVTGARVSDIVILVVAATEGVKPQTLEALDYIKQSNVPFLVCFTKIDLPSSDLELGMAQLEKNGVSFEGRGGDVPYVSVSSKTGEGVGNLLELLSLLSQVNEISGDSDGELEAYVVETKRERGGIFASVAIKNGSLRVGETIFVGENVAKIRGMFDFLSKPVKMAQPGDVVGVLGFSDLPEVGRRVSLQIDEKSQSRVIKRDLEKSEDIPVLIKAASSGGLEALMASLPSGFNPFWTGIGDLTESDVFTAKSASALIILFGVRAPSSVAKLCDMEGVSYSSFSVIYDLVDYLEKYLSSKSSNISGAAIVMASFPFSGKRVAGSKILEGQINVGDEIVLKRDDKVLGKAKIVSMRREKNEIQFAKPGEECGILFFPQLEFEANDMIISVKKKNNE